LAVGIAMGACVAAAAAAALVVPRDEWRGLVDLVVIVAVLAYTLLMSGLLALAMRGAAPHWRPGMFRVANPILVIAPLVVLLNGMSPYLGLKTENSFTMYSNLRTEAGYWNHSFMPQSMQVFGMQDRLVRVVSSTDEELQEAAADEVQLTWFAFTSRASRRPHDSVTYERDGTIHEVVRIGSDPALSEGPDPVLDRLLWFRAVPIAQGSFCTR
jgi:hypothetical protein